MDWMFAGICISVVSAKQVLFASYFYYFLFEVRGRRAFSHPIGADNIVGFPLSWSSVGNRSRFCRSELDGPATANCSL